MNIPTIVLLWFFVFIRAIIFVGIVCYIVIEFRRFKKRREDNDEGG
ncbi:hypothetical protein KAW48_11375 [candidate division WOR-3 bacterium]|nr:hypothetical protein [candidate division WOR-3 bacterium]